MIKNELNVLGFTDDELYIVRSAMHSYLDTIAHGKDPNMKFDVAYHSNKIQMINGILNKLYLINQQPKKKEDLSIADKIMHERVKLAKKGGYAQNKFAETAIQKINEAKTISYATFRANFACEVLMGVGYKQCTYECEKCPLHMTFKTKIDELIKNCNSLRDTEKEILTYEVMDEFHTKNFNNFPKNIENLKQG